MIIINGRFFSRRPTGVDRFAYELITALDELLVEDIAQAAGLKFEIWLPPGVEPPLNFQRIGIKTVGSHHGQLWEQWDLPRALQAEHFLLNLCNTAPVLTRRQLVVIHDAATVRVPAAFSLSFRLWYRLLMPLLGIVSRKILTVSEFSRQEINKAFRIPEAKIGVIHASAEHILKIPADTGAIAQFGLRARPYILAVSSLAAHKNFRLVLDAFARLDNPPFDIAIAGGANAKVFGEADIIRNDAVKWLGYVSDAQLRALYESALCFVFPSVYEGFGIPPLEAMRCGCPVLASSCASIPEVCGDAALYFDAHDADALAGLLVQLSRDNDLRKELKAKGLQHAAGFTWQNAAIGLLNTLQELQLS